MDLAKQSAALRNTIEPNILKPHALNRPQKPDVLEKLEKPSVAPQSAPVAYSPLSLPLEGGYELRLHKSDPASYDPGRDVEDVPGGYEDSERICLSCEQRRYVDGSDDSTVSFQTPTKVDPNASYAAVAAHEQEHVMHERAKAHAEGRKVISQTVTIEKACCPECGEAYAKGGSTRTVSVSEAGSAYGQMNKENQPGPQKFESAG